MSSRLGQTIQRYNAAMSSSTTSPECQQGLQSDCGGGGNAPSCPTSSSISSPPVPVTPGSTNTAAPSVGSITSTVASVIQSTPYNNHPNLYQHHSSYKGHRGHRRGHSYGGPISPHQSGIHHSQLEARPSHPNTAHPHGVILPSNSTNHWQKGHRRALSGCLPPTMGAVAWSSLRDLDSASGGTPFHGYHHTPPFRSLSPDGGPAHAHTDPSKPRPLSPEVVLSTGKLTPLTPDVAVDAQDLRRKKSTSESERRVSRSGSGRRKASGGSTMKRRDQEKQGLHDTSLDSMECGLGPTCFQQLANIKFFVFILAILVTLQQAVASGYVNSVITTIESRFEIPSRFVGMVASAYEMGNVITVMFVSYLGAKRHIPRWIAVGVLVMVVGCVVFTLPEFLTPANKPPGLMFSDKHGNGTTALSGMLALASLRPDMRNGVCHSANPQSSKFISEDGGQHHGTEHGTQHSHAGGNDSFPSVTKQDIMLSYGCTVEIVDEQGKTTVKASNQEEGFNHPLILFMLAQLLLGCGGSPLFTLGITYVDDHVHPDSSSVYIGTIYAMAAFGPVLGFLAGAYFLSVPSSSIGPDGKFLGVWWAGYLIAGGLLFVACLPFLGFPRLASYKDRLEEEEEEDEIEEQKKQAAVLDHQAHQRHDSFKEEDDAEVEAAVKAVCDGDSVLALQDQENSPPDEEFGQSLKNIPKSIWRLITNPTYIITCLGGCMELNIVSGFVVFLPKYLETQFELGKSESSLMVGGIAIPGACLGIFAGGYLVKRLQLKPSGAAKFVLATNILCLSGYVLFFFLGCSNPNLAGGTVPYPSDLANSLTATESGMESMNSHYANLNLTTSCNADCSCDNSMDPQLVCHNGITYYSPCHAGCSVNLTQCSCAGGANVTLGRCVDSPSPCNTLVPFMIVLFFMTGTVAVTQMPLLMIVLRSVTPAERSFALGMQFVIFRLFGYIPSPIIFGNVIDSSCMLWKVKRCSTLLPAVSGRCLLYDIEDFRHKYVGVLSALKLCALGLFLYDYFMLRRIEEQEEKDGSAGGGNGEDNHAGGRQADGKPTSGSIISLDKLFQESDTASAMTTLTTSTAIGPPPATNHLHPLTSESACVNVGGNATMMIIDAPPPQGPPPTSLSSSSTTTNNPVPVLLPEVDRAQHLHVD